MRPLATSRRRLWTTLALVAAGVVLPGTAPAQEPKRGGTLVVGYTQAPRHLNGAVQSGAATARRCARCRAACCA